MTTLIRQFVVRRSLSGILGGVCLSTLLIGLGSETQGADWMFRRSYFSHEIPEELADKYPRPKSRSAYRRAFARNDTGFSIRGGYRINRIQLRSGTSTDITVIREDWFNVNP